MSTFENTLKPHRVNANLKHYEEVYRTFQWDDINAEFSWHLTGKVNIGYEAIDRHAENPA
jgi:acetyl-CoA synthetase